MRLYFLILGLTCSVISNAQNFSCGDDLVDSRDQQVYKTVQIGDQCWMAENLNFGKIVPDFRQENNNIPEKTCYENNPENCKIFGGLYTWDEALAWNGSKNPAGICPEGWHVPGTGDWQELIEYLGEDSAGYKMKVDRDFEPSWDGSNESGFTALPAGAGYDKYFLRKGDWALFWASEENGETRAWFTQLDNYWYTAPPKYHNLYLGNYYKKFNGMSVRCIKD